MSTCRRGDAGQRVIADRHAEDCRSAHGAECGGCERCTEPHCRVCARVHADGTCAECLALARESLHDIARMCAALPEEVEHRGIEGEAMVLLGPSTDPERWGHTAASYQSGRLPEGWIEAAHGKECPLLVHEACTGCAGGELHPLFVLGTWDMLWRDVLDHEGGEAVTIATATAYLDMQMTYMAGNADVPFEDFARDLRSCRAHLEAVLQDGVQRDTGAPCMTCRVPLAREWGRLEAADGWRCPRCKEWRSDEDYRRNVAEVHQSHTEWLTAAEVETLTGVKPATLRKRVERKEAVSRRDGGRTVYEAAAIPEVVTRRSASGLAS